MYNRKLKPSIFKSKFFVNSPSYQNPTSPVPNGSIFYYHGEAERYALTSELLPFAHFLLPVIFFLMSHWSYLRSSTAYFVSTKSLWSSPVYMIDTNILKQIKLPVQLLLLLCTAKWIADFTYVHCKLYWQLHCIREVIRSWKRNGIISFLPNG